MDMFRLDPHTGGINECTHQPFQTVNGRAPEHNFSLPPYVAESFHPTATFRNKQCNMTENLQHMNDDPRNYRKNSPHAQKVRGKKIPVLRQRNNENVNPKELYVEPSSRDPHRRPSAAARVHPQFSQTSDPKLLDFTLHKRLGGGSFGQVVLATVRATGQRVALKVLAKRSVDTRKKAEHIVNERRALEQMNSPFTIKLRMAFQDKHHLYLAMDYIECGELLGVLRHCGPLTESCGRFYAAQLVLGLKYIHGLDLVHRDIKPENILVDAKGYIKITDFGFSKKIDRGGRTYSSCGTPQYTAPEIILGQGHDITVDWWSFGVVLYELMAGRAPFNIGPATTKVLLLNRIITGKVRYPNSFSPNLRELIGGLLCTDPYQRAQQAHVLMSMPWFGVSATPTPYQSHCV